jgi:chromosomal replication initiator protein
VTRDDTEVVSALPSAIADKVGEKRFALWLAGCRFDIKDGAVQVVAPTRFFQEWLRNNLQAEIAEACRERVSPDVKIDFLTAEQEERNVKAVTPAVAREQAQPASTGSSQARSGFAPRRQFSRLETFVTGASNRIAQASARTVAERPGSLSPLLFYGPTGVGKTHLLEGIWSAARQPPIEANAVYLSAEQFTTLFVEALHGTGLPSFRRKYRAVDLLILDDVQFFCGKRATVVEVLHTIDTLLREGKQLVMAADRPPADLGGLGPELTARLHGGMVCRIEPPDAEVRRGIVDFLATKLEVAIPADVRAFVAANLTSHARELSGALNRLQATSQALGCKVTLAMAEEALAEMIRQGSRLVRLADIEHAVCSVFGLDSKSLQSAAKARAVSQPRMLAMWLARKHTRAALSEICRHFGRRSHSTVICAQQKVDSWMAKNASLELADHNWTVEEAVRRVEANLRAG